MPVSSPGPDFLALPTRAGEMLVHAVVDTPRGSRNKYKYDPQLRVFRLSRVLPRGMHFPWDFGFIPGTLGADGDALDVVVLGEEPTFPGCLLTVSLIGVMRARQREKGKTIRNDRLLGVRRTPVNEPYLRELREVPRAVLDEVEQFFVDYNRAHGRLFEPQGRAGAAAAARCLRAGMSEFEGKKPGNDRARSKGR
ncbi:MAG TPA: inorganic diphosphatase [Steroidobacteraceae bacterium]|jgi:inorganic pyrophosphatase|nr:inorganic diphosphatase [Steroidobacteraceae bacterium]